MQKQHSMYLIICIYSFQCIALKIFFINISKINKLIFKIKILDLKMLDCLSSFSYDFSMSCQFNGTFRKYNYIIINVNAKIIEDFDFGF